MESNDSKSALKFPIDAVAVGSTSEMGFPYAIAPEKGLVATELIPLPGCKSQFWRYFGFYAHFGKIIEAKKRVVVCKLCLREMAYSGNTSNLSSHLNSRHPREFAAAKALSHVDRIGMRYASEEETRFKIPPSRHSPSSGSSGDGANFKMAISSLEQEPPPMKREILTPVSHSPPSSISIASGPLLPSPATHSPLEEAVTALSVDLLLSPTSLISSSAFADLLRLLDASVAPPTHLPLEPIYHRVREMVFPEAQRRAEDNFFVLSVDVDLLGSSCAQRTILHSVDTVWTASHVSLETTLCGLHGEPELWSQHICRIMNSWDLNCQSLVGIVTSGSWVETTTMEKLNAIREHLSWPLILPLEALLGRVVRRATARNEFGAFKTSALDDWKAQSENEQSDTNVLPEWYRYCQHLRREGPSSSTERTLLALLEPLESVWRQLSTEDRMHLSVVRPLGALLKKQLATAGEASEGKTSDVDWPAIRKKWTEILSEEFEADENHQVASLLDPRFKSLPFVAETEREGFHVHLRAQACSKAAQVYPEGPSPVGESDLTGPSAKKSRNSTEVLLSEFFSASGAGAPGHKNQTSLEDKVDREISNYLCEADLPLDGNPLAWWRSKAGQYPLLSHLARRFFCLPGLLPSRAPFVLAQPRLPLLDPEVQPLLTFLKEHYEWIAIERNSF